MRFRRYLLTEKTFNISKDVKFVYDKAYKKYIDSLIKSEVKGKGDYRAFKGSAFPQKDEKIRNGQDVLFATIDGSELPSNEAKKANELNPVTLFCGVFRNGSFYTSKEQSQIKNKCKIQISLHRGALWLILRNEQENVPHNQLKEFYNEISAARIRATIAHEISHWMNDTFHNYHISKMLNKAMEFSDREILLLNKKDVNMTHFEIDAQMHGIKQLKVSNKKNWDNMTLLYMFRLYTPMMANARGINKYGKDVLDIWQKKVIMRMNREKLLGKNMRNFIKPAELK